MLKEKKVFVSIDGNEAAAYGAYAFSEVAAIYPITPSSPIAEHIDAWSALRKKSIFDAPVKVIEMQSEAGAAGAVHGAMQAGALASTYTASQGLLLMIPNIYKCVGEMLPAVFHVAARSIATRALSIFGDHQDIYAIRQSGIPMLASHSVQEVADLAPLAHAIAIKASVPMLHFFDGFRTSHEIQKIEVLPYEKLETLIDKDALSAFRKRALNPHTNPITRGGAESDDLYFQGREAQNTHYNNVINVAVEYFDKINKLTGRHYAPFTYYGHKDATKVIVAMGSVTETTQEVVDALNKKGEKVGLVKVHLYRPFSPKHLLDVLPKTVKKIAVLDRTKEIGALGEPLYLDVNNVVKNSDLGVELVIGGRYGLSSKDTQPRQIKAVYDHLDSDNPFHGFTIGIIDDVTFLSLKEDPTFEIKHDYTSCLFYGLGSDGTVSANKNSIKIIGDNTELYSQAYFAYDSKKAGGATRSNLRFGPTPIKSTYYIQDAEFVSCSLDTYLFKYDMLANLKNGGTFLLNTSFDKDSVIDYLPNRVKKQLAEKNAKFYIIDASKIAEEVGMGRNTNTILQASFFKLNPSILPYEDAVKYMKDGVVNTYGRKGDDIVEANFNAIDKGGDSFVEIIVDPKWKDLNIVEKKNKNRDDEYFNYFIGSIAALKGNEVPVSQFIKHDLVDGSMKNDVTFYEERNIATEVPEWISENCIQCGRCAFVCPHATIRAFALTEEEVNNAPDIVKEDLIDVLGGPNVKGLKWRIQVSPLNCVGCSLCAVECPGKGGKKALVMRPAKTQAHQEEGANYLYKKVTYKDNLFPVTTQRGAAMLRPYFEVSGACAGCGETPYYRLATQLFGKDMLIANATGCTSIYSASTPWSAFSTDENKQGPAWANSLFEDNAEFGFGMRLATNFRLYQVAKVIEDNLNKVEEPLREVLTEYLEHQTTNRDKVRELLPSLLKLVKESKNKDIKTLLELEGDLVDKSVWIIGGDGWAYDIGYGGLDHVIANNENVNILVLDTEVYSNTGGQASKASNMGAIAKFAASGKKTAKKDLAALAMAYQHVYVATVSMGANAMQTIKAFKEAESYNGPSVIIAYSPCIEHGLKGGLQNHQAQQKLAVESGYFPIYRFDPRKIELGENPLQLDFKEPDFSKYRTFLENEVRFSQLPNINPSEAEELFARGEKFAKQRYERLKQMAK